MLNIKRIYAIFLRQYYLIQHNKTRLVPIFGWVAVDVILWGFITKYLGSIGESNFNFTAVFLGVVILWGFMNRIYQGIIMGYFEDMWSRNFFNIFASPLKVSEYLIGLISTSIITSALALAVMFLIAFFLFAFNIFQIGILFIPLIAVLIIFGISLGIFTTSLVLRFGPPAEWFAWIIPFIISPFTAVFYPISVLPKAMQSIAAIIPPSYIFEGFRAILMTGEFSPKLFFYGLISSLIYLVIAYSFFIMIYRVVLRKGLISRFAAESL